MKTQFLVVGLTWVVVVLGPATESHLLAQEADVPVELLKTQVASARRGYELTWKMHQEGIAKGDFESLCVWSIRWFHAERDLSKKSTDRVAAAEAHLERMKTAEERAKLFEKAGHDGAVRQAVAAEFYRVQAQIWLAQAKGK
jgi:hypothetical protein